VEQFSVEFFGLSSPNELITYPTELGDIPVSYSSTFTNLQSSLIDLPEDAPSNLACIRISILCTTDNTQGKLHFILFLFLRFSPKNIPPTNMKFTIIACFYPSTTETTTETLSTISTPSSTSTPSPTTTALCLSLRTHRSGSHTYPSEFDIF
jgi:hypothetical protein